MPKINPSKYALERLLERQRQVVHPGPVITISREYGCPSKIIASIVTNKINEFFAGKRKWSWISKEILEESARKLGLTPREIKYIFEYKKHHIIEDLLISQEKKQYYHTDWTIRKTIGEVIRAIAMEGRVIIVGRAGVALSRDIEASIHIRLIAPQRWRAVHVSKIRNIPYKNACKLLQEKDNNRKKFLEYYLKKSPDHTVFDVLYNCSALSKEDISLSILDLARQKKLI